MPSLLSLNASKKKKKIIICFEYKQKMDAMPKTSLLKCPQMLRRDTPACSFMILPHNAANGNDYIYSMLWLPLNPKQTSTQIIYLAGE